MERLPTELVLEIFLLTATRNTTITSCISLARSCHRCHAIYKANAHTIWRDHIAATMDETEIHLAYLALKLPEDDIHWEPPTRPGVTYASFKEIISSRSSDSWSLISTVHDIRAFIRGRFKAVLFRFPESLSANDVPDKDLRALIEMHHLIWVTIITLHSEHIQKEYNTQILLTMDTLSKQEDLPDLTSLDTKKYYIDLIHLHWSVCDFYSAGYLTELSPHFPKESEDTDYSGTLRALNMFKHWSVVHKTIEEMLCLKSNEWMMAALMKKWIGWRFLHELVTAKEEDVLEKARECARRIPWEDFQIWQVSDSEGI